MSRTFLPTSAVSSHGQRTLPQSMYTSAEHFALEWERVLGRRWLLVMREADLARPGDYRLVDLHGESIIVLRDQQGVLRAFFNLCRHRGTRLCERPEGQLGPLIQCPYHAWTYALDGRLVGVPDLKEMEGFDRSDFPLHPCALTTWNGFVFLNLARDPEPFERSLAPLIGRLEAHNLSSLVALRRVEYDLRANWKLLHQNYSECYHCSPLHPALVKLSPSTSGENDLVDGPVLGGFMVISTPGGSLTRSGRPCGVPVGALDEIEQQRVYYYAIFPNMLLSLHHDYVMVHTLWPLAPDRTRVTCEFLFHPDTATRADLDPDDGVAFWDQVNREDWSICERTHAGITSSRYVPGPYSRRESLSAAFDREYLRALEGVGS
ncbi:MAG TPA: aromatic ring-hydroxylating dioxygenase subunit alpha [Labilithrix sp.]|nr:aromatic ring-hydroxylating dioxygenase subunit alpha [Labilithrix sp.]